jgi:hypothetical protein
VTLVDERALHRSIEPRCPTHLSGCVELARTTHQVDGYPVVLQADIEELLAPRSQLAAWVAVSGDLVVATLHCTT